VLTLLFHFHSLKLGRIGDDSEISGGTCMYSASMWTHCVYKIKKVQKTILPLIRSAKMIRSAKDLELYVVQITLKNSKLKPKTHKFARHCQKAASIVMSF
jgi:hypothetical protein